MWSGWRSVRALEVVVLAIIAYVPVLLSSPGRVSADSKQALYVDPGEFLAGAVNMWDQSFGAGTVPHQHIGYLWPIGPWFWTFETLGVPDWIAQRLWLGTLIMLAGLGARWLARSIGASPATAFAVGLVYALSPYQLAFTARASILLLPWVGLPWMVELTRRAIRHGGWRHPALFGLVVATAASSNATSLVLVGLGPALVLLHAAVTRGMFRRAFGAGGRMGAVFAFVSAWWIVGVRIQGSHGLPVLHLTENLSDVARWSLPVDILRGLGNWFFAGRDRLGYSVDQAQPFLENELVVAATLILPAAALMVAVLVKGRLRMFAVAAIAVAMVIGVGAWPIDQPSWYGRAYRWFVEETAAGLALRNSHRIVPLLVLGVVVLLAVGIERLPRLLHRQIAAGAVVMAAIAAMAPAILGGYLSDHLDRPEDLPDEWIAAADALNQNAQDEVGNPQRVLEVPGSPFAAHRWGNTVEPILPWLLDRPHLAREVLPYGSEGTANLLDAFDRRMQEGTFEPESLAPIARLFSSSDVVVRSDLAFERFRTPIPSSLWRRLTDPVPPGVGEVTTFGEPRIDQPDRRLAPISERDLDDATAAREPVAPAGVLSIDDAPGLLQVMPADDLVVLAGDGDGIVDAAASGLVDGRAPLLYADTLGDPDLQQAAERGASLILTDTNRRRIQTWFYAIRDTRGPTERAGETIIEPTGYDVRVDPFDGIDDRSRTVVEHLGAQVTASSSGGAARPEDRAVAAFDDDLQTAWRVGGADPRGQRLSLVLDDPVEVEEITFTQPQDGPRDRVVEQVRLHLDSGRSIDLDLTGASFEPSGQRFVVPRQMVERMEVEITGVSLPGFDPALANAVGFAEIEIAGLEVAETVVLPPSMLRRLGDASDSVGLDVVMTRLRTDPYDGARTDPERHLDRTVELPGPRSFGVGGSARINPRAPDEELNDLLGLGSEISTRSSSRLAGSLEAMAASTVDGHGETAWTAAFGEQVGQWVELELDAPRSVGSIRVDVVIDETHSVPAVLRVEIDGEVIGHHQVTAPDAAAPSGRHTEVIAVPDRPFSRVRLVVEEIYRRSSPPDESAVMSTLPVSIAEIEVGEPNAAIEPREDFDTGCRDDLLLLDGSPVPLRITGARDDVRRGLSVALCSDALQLDGGRTRLVAAPGHQTGIDLDRLVLGSRPSGEPRLPGVRGGRELSGTQIVSVEDSPTSWTAAVDTDGTEFWLVMGQSHNDGWSVSIDGATVGPLTLINGYANGWLIDPDAPGSLAVHLEWEPQRLVWWALAISVFAVAVCIGLVIGTPPASLDRWPAVLENGLSDDETNPPLTHVVMAVVVSGIGVAAVSRPWIGVVAAGLALLRIGVPQVRFALAATIPIALGVGVVVDRVNPGWLVMAVVVAGVVGAEVRDRWSGIRAPRREAREPSR